MKETSDRRQQKAAPDTTLVSPHCGTAQYSQRMFGFEVKHQGLSLIPPGFLQLLSEFFNSGITSTDRRCWWGTYGTRQRRKVWRKSTRGRVLWPFLNKAIKFLVLVFKSNKQYRISYKRNRASWLFWTTVAFWKLALYFLSCQRCAVSSGIQTVVVLSKTLFVLVCAPERGKE